MNAENPQSIERLLQLLSDRATEGLDSARDGEVEALLARYPHVESDELEFAAALLDATLYPVSEALPEKLKRKIERDAARTLSVPTPATRSSSLMPFVTAGGWLTAACLMILIWSQDRNDSRPRNIPSSVTQATDNLLAQAGTRLYRGALGNRSGEVIWNGDRQEGYLKLTGLKPNDPSRSRYQLWIVDAGRPGSAPVDGGLFDVTADREFLRVVAKLPILDAKLFAVTEEEPSGGVVSTSEKLLVLAR